MGNPCVTEDSGKRPEKISAANPQLLASQLAAETVRSQAIYHAHHAAAMIGYSPAFGITIFLSGFWWLPNFFFGDIMLRGRTVAEEF
jgi:hypothetical protein